MAMVIWSRVTTFWLKSGVTPNLVRVSAPEMRSKTGSGSSSLIGIISGRIPKTLDIEKLGNFMSKLPTFVVVKVPLEVSHFAGAYLSSWGIFLRSLFLIKARSPSEPESRRIRQALFGSPLFLALANIGRPATAALMPSPVTTALLLRLAVFKSTILIGGLLVPVKRISSRVFLDATLILLIFFLGLEFRRSQHPIS